MPKLIEIHFELHHGSKLGGTLLRIEGLDDKSMEVDKGSITLAPALLLKLGRNLIRADSTASLSALLFEG